MPSFETSPPSPALAALRAAALRGDVPRGLDINRAAAMISRAAAITRQAGGSARAGALQLMRRAASHITHHTSTPPRFRASNDSTDSPRAKLWHKHMSLRLRSERRITAAITITLSDLVADLAASRFNASTPPASTLQLANSLGDSLLTIVFNLKSYAAKLTELITSSAKESMRDAAEQLSEELGLDNPWLMPDERVLDHVRARENLIASASDEIFEDVKVQIEDGLNNGEGSQQIARRVESTLGTTRERADTIARTETGAAYGQARQDGFEGTGIKFVEWLTARDDIVRATHVRLDGVIIQRGDFFTVGKCQLRFPCDPNGTPADEVAGEVINCRCVQVASRGPATRRIS